MSRLSYKHWTVISLLLLAGGVATIVTVGGNSRYLITLVLPPLVASLLTTPRRTAVVAALTVGAAVALGATNFRHDGGDLVLRAGVVLVVAAISVQISILRERDLRTRRRITLINTARAELEGSNGFEDELSSLGRAAVVDFADWVILDIRIGSDPAERRVFASESSSRLRSFAAREIPDSTTTAYEERASRDGVLILHDSDATELIGSLFDGPTESLRTGSVIVVPARSDDFSVVYFLVCPDPHPPWAQAEATQVESLARSAVLAARSDRLIDELSFARSELQSSRDQIQAIVNAIDDGVTAQSISGEMLFANEQAAEMFGLASADDLIGMHFGDVHPLMDLRDESGRPFDPMNLPSKRAFSGESSPEAILRYTIKESGREWWTHVRARAIRGRDDTPKMAISVIEDVTEQRRDQLASRLLAEASLNLHRSLSEANAIEATANAVISSLGDWCSIDLYGASGDLQLARCVHSDPTLSQALSDSLLLRDASTAAHVVAGDENRESLHSGPEAHIQVFGEGAEGGVEEGLRCESAIVAPITARGESLGAITVARTSTPLRHTEHDLATLAELGRRAGAAIDNSRVHADRTEMLQVLQRSLIPPQLPPVDGLHLTAKYLAAEHASEIGGDFYDVLTLADGSAAIVVGDICGKGTRAAALTAMVRHTLRTAAMTERDIVSVVTTLNTALIGYDEPDQFCTLSAIRFGARQNGGRELTVVNCGHPLPIVVSANDVSPVGTPGTLLGIVEDADVSATTLVLGAGQQIVAYTDGLSGGETVDDTAFALETIGIAKHANSHPSADEICDAALARHQQRRRDDIAVVTAELHPSA